MSTESPPVPHASAPKQKAAPEVLTGSGAILRSLEKLGITEVFGLPGGAIMPFYDELMSSSTIRHILVRHEQGAGHAAQGYAAATGKVGEQADGYMGLVGSAPAGIRSRMDAVNIQRRAFYTERAAARGATIEEFAASTACEIFARRIGPGQYYRLPDGVWRRLLRNPAAVASLITLAIIVFLAVPVVNLLTPLFAAALMVHLHQRIAARTGGLPAPGDRPESTRISSPPGCGRSWRAWSRIRARWPCTGSRTGKRSRR